MKKKISRKKILLYWNFPSERFLFCFVFFRFLDDDWWSDLLLSVILPLREHAFFFFFTAVMIWTLVLEPALAGDGIMWWHQSSLPQRHQCRWSFDVCSRGEVEHTMSYNFTFPSVPTFLLFSMPTPTGHSFPWLEIHSFHFCLLILCRFRGKHISGCPSRTC